MESLSPQQPPLKKWRGVLASFLIPGAGAFLSGNHRKAFLWFFGILALQVITLLAPGIPFHPVWLFFGGYLMVLVAWLTMLYDSCRPTPVVHGWTWVLLIAAVFAVGDAEEELMHAVVNCFRVPSEGMSPTIEKGDHIVASRWPFWFKNPEHSDIVVFSTAGMPLADRFPSTRGQVFVKRVIGVPGDVLKVEQGEITVNGAPFHPKQASIGYHMYPNAPFLGHENAELTVPPNEFFLVGDNTDASLDSRFFGTIPRKNITGKIVFTYLPLSRIGQLH